MPYESRALRCSDGELSEIIEFAVGVFNVDFPNLLPRLYRDGASTGHDHFAVRENGRLVAAVISFPLDATVAGHTFKTYGVGTVSVAEDCRGKGYMTDLLASCLNDAFTHGAALSVLLMFAVAGFIPETEFARAVNDSAVLNSMTEIIQSIIIFNNKQ